MEIEEYNEAEDGANVDDAEDFGGDEDNEDRQDYPELLAREMGMPGNLRQLSLDEVGAPYAETIRRRSSQAAMQDAVRRSTEFALHHS